MNRRSLHVDETNAGIPPRPVQSVHLHANFQKRHTAARPGESSASSGEMLAVGR